MSFGEFIEKITEVFGENAIVRNDRENGLYTAKFDEWRIRLSHSSRRPSIYNVRNKRMFTEEW